MAAPARKCETDSKRSHHNDQQVGEQCENAKLVETREAPDSSEDERKANELEPVSIVGATGKKVSKQIRAQTKQKRQRKRADKTSTRRGQPLHEYKSSQTASQAHDNSVNKHAHGGWQKGQATLRASARGVCVLDATMSTCFHWSRCKVNDSTMAGQWWPI